MFWSRTRSATYDVGRCGALLFGFKHIALPSPTPQDRPVPEFDDGRRMLTDAERQLGAAGKEFITFDMSELMTSKVGIDFIWPGTS